MFLDTHNVKTWRHSGVAPFSSNVAPFSLTNAMAHFINIIQGVVKFILIYNEEDINNILNL